MTSPTEEPVKQTILVVDDTPDNITLLSSLLKGQYRLKVATSGEKALEIAESGEPDLILLDIMMPGMDGYEVCRRLKADARMREMPVIFLSALNETMDKVKAFSMGGVDYITKPFEPDEVKARVATHLKVRQFEVALERQNQQLQESYAKLRELESLRNSLTHMLVHDMRTPLTSINGYLQMLEMYERESLSTDGQEFLTIAIASTEHLIEMVSSILDVSKMEAGEMKLHIEEWDLTGTAREMLTKLDSLKEERLLTVEAPDDPVVIAADHHLITRVIQNLLGNALKFTRADGTIAIVLEPRADAIRVAVRDNGPGIPPEYREKIFEKFGQVEARAQQQKYSTGIGLTFCKYAIDLHAGAIGVDSELDHGSTFWFVLPQPARNA